MRIGARDITPEGPPYVIAELGVNHDGRPERAEALVDAAAAAGADAVKLQLFDADRLLGAAADLAAYQRDAGAVNVRDMLRRLELPVDAMAAVLARARAAGLHAIVTVFSVELVDDAERLNVDAYKTASPDLIHRPLIERLLATGRPLLLSTGAATAEEVSAAVAWVGPHPHVLLQCVSAYPCPDADAALDGRRALLALDPWALGYSDHTTAADTGALAVAGGACVLEKHLTRDRAAAGPDHAASLDPAAFAEYVRLARRAWSMRGPAEKRPGPGEADVRRLSRQSVTARRDLDAGHVLGAADLTIKRPGTGLAPAALADVVGRRLARSVRGDHPLVAEDLA